MIRKIADLVIYLGLFMLAIIIFAVVMNQIQLNKTRRGINELYLTDCKIRGYGSISIEYDTLSWRADGDLFFVLVFSSEQWLEKATIYCSDARVKVLP